jgi:hypothetical protein
VIKRTFAAEEVALRLQGRCAAHTEDEVAKSTYSVIAAQEVPGKEKLQYVLPSKITSRGNVGKFLSCQQRKGRWTR